MKNCITKIWRRAKLPAFLIANKKRWTCFYWALVLILILAVQPLKWRAYHQLENAGDTALMNQNFDLAIANYQKLRLIKIRNPEAVELVNLARSGQSDIFNLEQFYLNHHQTKIIDLMSKTKANYLQTLSEADGLKNCEDIFNQGQTQLGLNCTQNLTVIWPRFRDGWATLEEMAKIVKDENLANLAHQHALELDPNYQ